MPFDVLVMPLAIVAATYALGAERLGAPRDHDGPLPRRLASRPPEPRHRAPLPAAHRRAGFGRHRWLLSTAFYLPMIAAVAYYTSTAPTHEGEPFHGSLSTRRSVGAGGAGGRQRAGLPGLDDRPDRGRGRASGTSAPRGRRPSRRTLARPRERAGLRQRLRARRLEFVVRPRPRHAPRGAVPLLHLRRGAADRAVAWSRRRSGAPPAGPVRGVAGVGLASWAACTCRGSTGSSPS